MWIVTFLLKKQSSDILGGNMKKRDFKGLLLLLLTLLGLVAIFTGMLKDAKIFYAIAAVCMGLSSIGWFLNSRSAI